MQLILPNTLEEAVEKLASACGQGYVLAGGTDLIVQMQSAAKSPALVVDIKGIPETQIVQRDKEGWSIGASVCGAELHENERLKAEWPGVIEAVDLIGSMQVQGRATPVGNLCNASPAADSVPALIAAGARAHIAGPQGERFAPVEEIPTGPGTNSLSAGEIVVALKLPAREGPAGDAYLRLIPRTEMDIAVVGAGVNLTLNAEGVCSAARVSLGAVAPTALLAEEAAETLVGTRLETEDLDRAARAAESICRPIDDKRGAAAYRVHAAGVLVRRAALIALARAWANG